MAGLREWLKGRRRLLAGAAALVLSAIVVLLVLRAACPGEPYSGETLVIAAVGPLSGDAAFQGRTLVEAAQLAVDEANVAGGLRGHEVRLAVFDDANDAKGAPALAARVADGTRALAVIGHRSSDVCVAAGKVYREKRIPAVTGGATAPEITQGNPWYFRVLFDNEFQGRFLADYARQVLGQETIGVVFAEEASGRSLAAAFRRGAEAGGPTIVREWSFDAKDERVAERLSAIAAEVAACVDCGALLVAGSERPSRLALRSLRDGGVKLTVLAGQAVGRENFNDYFKEFPAEQRQPGFYTDHVYAASLALPDTAGAHAQEFRRRYRARWGGEPDTAAYAFYDATRLVLQGLDRGGAQGSDVAGERVRLREYLGTLTVPARAFPGTTGSIFFDASNNAVKAVPMGMFLYGKLVSAPTQLTLVARPDRTPDFEERLADGSILRVGERFMARVQVAYTGIDVVSIPDVDIQGDTFTADLFVWFRTAGDVDLSGIEFANAVDPTGLGEPIWTRRRGEFTTSTFRVKTTFRGDFDFHRYPFDRQALRVEIRHRTRTTSSLILALDRLGMQTSDGRLDPKAKLAAGNVLAGTRSWRLADAVAYQDILRSSSTLGEIGVSEAEAGLEYSRINEVITIERYMLSYALKNIMPLLFVILILYFGYFLPYDEIGTRSTIAITALLTVAVVYQQLSAELPAIGYLVSMDYGFYAAFGLALHSTLVCILVYIAQKREWTRLPWYLDLSGIILTPLVLVAMAVVVALRYGGSF